MDIKDDEHTCWCGDDVEDHKVYPLDWIRWRPCTKCDCEEFQPRTQLRLPGVNWDEYERARDGR
jgi:hypothetical protein